MASVRCATSMRCAAKRTIGVSAQLLARALVGTDAISSIETRGFGKRACATPASSAKKEGHEPREPEDAAGGAATKKVLVFGGSGYVGRRVCQSLIALAARDKVQVTSVSRSGCFSPVSSTDLRWVEQVEWMRADAAAALVDQNAGETAAIQTAMRDADAVVSCIGAFGSDSFMQRMNGDVNIALARTFAATTARAAPRFVFVSTAPFRFPDVVLRGYFNGKKRAEDAALECFGDNATILRPSFVHGTRDVPGNIRLPLGLVGRPLEAAASMVLPSLSPISVDDVGKAAAVAALGGDLLDNTSIWEYEQMTGAAGRA